MMARTLCFVVAMLAAATARAQDSHAGHDMPMDHAMPMEHDMSAMQDDAPPLPGSSHVPPPPPATTMRAMSAQKMADVMDMHDDAIFGMLKVDELERVKSGDGYATAWEAEGWLGGDRDKLWVRTEGERDRNGTHDARIELLFDRAFAPFWDWQLGVRHDFGQGPSREWAAFGVQGLAPYWFETQATFYIGENGRTAARLEASYDLLLTQRLILAPRIELNAYGKDDPERGIGTGLSDLEAGLRLRYEFNRHVAPYVGVAWKQRYGDTARYARAAGDRAGEVQWLAGVRFWF
jgi:copper resistance protein B